MELNNNSTASQAVVEKVAQQEDVDSTELETPLYDVVDADALDKLVSSMSTDGIVSFHYSGYQLIVAGDGSVELAEEDAPTS
ncbi:HalOD1 output domain-containing protein [Halopenitus persicus]|uniref:HalOD1 output domain-containing protein n=1 Tax=Halopenitus persicus TaxID=1048396 RepID=UPI0018EE557E|nr:HalOD1 output domain-containing protein [Halopenitus persicus]